MSRRGLCPHPEKKRWPLEDVGGSRCRCGCVWEPYLFATANNLGIEHARQDMRLEVYQCRDRSGRQLPHWHTTDMRKQERRHAERLGLDEPVSSTLLSGQDIHDRPHRTWSGRRKARKIGHAERRRLARHRR